MGIYNWLKDKYERKEESSSSERSDADIDGFLKGKHLEELSFDEYVVLIDSYCDDTETLGMMADAITLNAKISPGEKDELWDRIDRETIKEREK